MKLRHLACSVFLLAGSVHGVAETKSSAPLASHEHDHQQQDIAFCGHKANDSAALRARAGELIQWREVAGNDDSAWQRFKILGFNDFHGQLQSRSLFGRPVGGAAVLAAYLQQESREVGGHSIIVHAGDHVGASPPVSALLQDEPSITFLNMLANKHCSLVPAAGSRQRINEPSARATGASAKTPLCNVVGTLGNHEFDEGVGELTRLLNGGNHPDGPFLQDIYQGSAVPYVNANVFNIATGKPLLAPYNIKLVGGVRVAFIGAVLQETPSIVTPSGVAGVEFIDEAEAINRLVPELQRKGIRAIVVTIHQGARQRSYGGATESEQQDLSGPIADIVNRLDSEIDIVVSGHAHGFTNQLVSNAEGKEILITQAFSRGTAYADIDVAIDPRSGDIVEKSARIITTWADVEPGLSPDPAIAGMTQQAVASVALLVNQVIGNAAQDITRTANSAGESALGNLIADAQRKAMATDIALMNPGGIRADLPAGEITWGDLFTVQPFNNDLITMNLSGVQIKDLLEQQWLGQSRPRILKTSGLHYTWDASAPDGSKVVDIALASGAALEPSTLYSVTANSFIAGGGDNFSVLSEGTHRVIGAVDLDALVAYIETIEQPFNTQIEGRIQRSD
ncbi:MAG: bifunctional metallophosphatase/5'-nucleotidase [Gammaproteobacteria bacterium]|nr:bifunctional metallophosphatase/5'-nucleotidase [Gammaproteobacteria bacterium]MBQ0838368.1 bifunctional metallophosphatase/5'-nucleotidase [Gammaproteobacteria bacterium]